jgi:hypothetical protein
VCVPRVGETARRPCRRHSIATVRGPCAPGSTGGTPSRPPRPTQRARSVTQRARSVTQRARSVTPRALSVTQRALSVTQRALSVTQRALSVTQRALSVTQRALSVTQRALGVTQRALRCSHALASRAPQPLLALLILSSTLIASLPAPPPQDSHHVRKLTCSLIGAAIAPRVFRAGAAHEIAAADPLLLPAVVRASTHCVSRDPLKAC